MNEGVTGVAPAAGTETHADSPGPSYTSFRRTGGAVGKNRPSDNRTKKLVGNLHEHDTDQDEHPAAAKIEALFSGLPLSKLALAVGEHILCRANSIHHVWTFCVVMSVGYRIFLHLRPGRPLKVCHYTTCQTWTTVFSVLHVTPRLHLLRSRQMLASPANTL